MLSEEAELSPRSSGALCRSRSYSSPEPDEHERRHRDAVPGSGSSSERTGSTDAEPDAKHHYHRRCSSTADAPPADFNQRQRSQVTNHSERHAINGRLRAKSTVRIPRCAKFSAPLPGGVQFCVPRHAVLESATLFLLFLGTQISLTFPGIKSRSLLKYISMEVFKYAHCSLAVASTNRATVAALRNGGMIIEKKAIDETGAGVSGVGDEARRLVILSSHSRARWTCPARCNYRGGLCRRALVSVRD